VLGPSSLGDMQGRHGAGGAARGHVCVVTTRADGAERSCRSLCALCAVCEVSSAVLTYRAGKRRLSRGEIMTRNKAAIVTTVSTVMLGAAWVTGIVGTALNSSGGSTTIVAQGAGSPVASTAGSSSTATSSSPSSTTSAAASGTFSGASVGTRYGDYQAQITVTAGKVTNITMLKSGNKDGTSQQISGYALPQLISAVLKQQKANVGYVSGASYTTQGFESSVQDAMTQAGLA